VDTSHLISADAKLAIVTDKDEDGVDLIRHSTAHLLAYAVKELFPEAQVTIGPMIENGFYYDFAYSRPFTPEDLVAIEKRMAELAKKDLPVTRKVLPRDEAVAYFNSIGEKYKAEIIESIPADQDVSLYSEGGFTDLCRGPHVPSTGKLKAFKLMSIAGAYWRGDEHNKMLQRIYGTAWESAQQLKDYLWQLEEAKKRDHRKLGKELEIFFFDEEVGPGLPLWPPNGGVMIEELEKLAKEMEDKAGYLRVRTPHLSKEDLFIHSGHLPYYAESMYPPMELEGVKYYVKPMNCPMHHKIFGSKPRSYRDLPIRLAEYGTVYRYEKSGELFGLMRVRSLQMNDAHMYVSEDLFEQEFLGVVDLYLKYFKLFGIEKYVMRLSLHSKQGLGKKYVDNERLWLKTEEMVRSAMKNGNVPFVEAEDEAAFYGPKIDVQIWSVIGKEFSLATNQVDFAQPARFDLKFINKQGVEEVPLCIHRAPLSTHERMIGFLIEHYGGNFPVWLSPEQVRVIPITDAQTEYAQGVVKQLREEGVRVSADISAQRMNAKIRSAQIMKVPYMLVVGENEMNAGQVSLRVRDGSQQNNITLDEFKARVKDKIAIRSGEL